MNWFISVHTHRLFYILSILMNWFISVRYVWIGLYRFHTYGLVYTRSIRMVWFISVPYPWIGLYPFHTYGLGRVVFRLFCILHKAECGKVAIIPWNFCARILGLNSFIFYLRKSFLVYSDFLMEFNSTDQMRLVSVRSISRFLMF